MRFDIKRSMRSLLVAGLALYAAVAVASPSETPAIQADSAAALAAAASIPRYDHVVIVMEENTSETNIYGNSSAPYINSLKDNGAYFTQSFAVSHPSQPNYLALFSGSTQGISDDSCPHTFSANNLGNELRVAGLSFAGYSESMPSNGYTGCTSGNYARKHSPWINFSDLPATTNLTFASWPVDFTTLPTVSFVIPNLCDDMHDCSIASGDTWLKNNLDAYAQWARTHNSLLIVTWDEDDSTTSANQIATIFYGANLHNGAYAEPISHYNVLRTLEDMYGLAALGSAASATAITDVWGATAADFSLSAAPATLTVAQGSSGSDTTTVASLNGFNAPVTLSVSGLPSGATATFGSNPVTPAANGSVNSGLAITVASTTNLGTWTVTVTGTSGSLSHAATFNLTVSQPPPVDFTVSASPASLALTQGSAGTDAITVTSSNGFNNAVSLAVAGLPAGVSASFSPTSVTPAANGSASATLTLTASATATTGTATLAVSATSGALAHSTAITLTINPASSNVLQNGVPVSNLSAAKGAQLNYTVNVPAGASNLVIATSGGSGDADLYIRFAAAPTLSSYDCRPYISGNAETCTIAAPQAGTYYVMLNAYAAFSGVTLKASWTVGTPDFAVAAAPNALSVTQGASSTDTITVSSLRGFNGAVTFAASGLPSGVTAVFAPASITPPANGTASTTLTLAASSTAASGTATITITSTSGSISHSAALSLTVNPTGGATQLLANTGFETSASWTASSGVICATGCSGESAHAGSGFAWLDGYGSTHTDTLSQAVTIPSGKTSATLQYYLHVDTAETGTTALDKLNVQVLNSSGTVLATLASFSNLNAANGFVVQTSNLTPYIGQSVTVKFTATENASLQTSFVLDDVTLNVQ